MPLPILCCVYGLCITLRENLSGRRWRCWNSLAYDAGRIHSTSQLPSRHGRLACSFVKLHQYRSMLLCKERSLRTPVSFSHKSLQHCRNVLECCLVMCIVFTARCYTERGIATAIRPSVRLSVYDVEISWSHWLISLCFLLSADPNITNLLQKDGWMDG